MRITLTLVAVSAMLLVGPARAQKAPEAGYVFPAGGKAGTVVNVQLGGYDWTPDMEFFVHDKRVQLIPTGTLSPILIPPPPYWFGAKGRIAALPIPREMAGKFVLPVDLPAGPITWQAANANGCTSTRTFIVGAGNEIVEDETPHPQPLSPKGRGEQVLPGLPITVSGRLFKNEEVDRYQFVAAKDGPITCDLMARRLGSKFLGILEVRDTNGRLIADALGTSGSDPSATFAAKAGTAYVVSVHDIDFGGDRSYVYRLSVTPGTGGEATTAVPAKSAEQARRLNGAGTITDIIDQVDVPHRYSADWKKGQVWSLSLYARRIGSPLDVALAIVSPGGKEVAKNDDLPDTTDAGLDFTVPADGTYEIVVSDTAGKTGVYRLAVREAVPDFALQVALQRVNVPQGGKFDLALTAVRKGGFKGPIDLTIKGLPEGITTSSSLRMVADKAIVSLEADKDAGIAAGLVSIEGAADLLPRRVGFFSKDGFSLSRPTRMVTRAVTAPTTLNLAPRGPEENRVANILVTSTLKPNFKGRPFDADTGRKVHRGSTFPAEVVIERLDGFDGEIVLQMAATQSYQVQGITGGDVIVPPGVKLALYPCYLPEWLETIRTSRMGMIGVAKVPDPKGKIRYQVAPMTGFITVTMEGALLKVSADNSELAVKAGQPFDVRLKVARLAKLTEPARLELRVPDDLAGRLKAEPVTVGVGKEEVLFRITPAADLVGLHTFSIRATAMQDGRYPTISEAAVTVELVR